MANLCNKVVVGRRRSLLPMVLRVIIPLPLWKGLGLELRSLDTSFAVEQLGS